jgi:hypothetical protein
MCIIQLDAVWRVLLLVRIFQDRTGFGNTAGRLFDSGKVKLLVNSSDRRLGYYGVLLLLVTSTFGNVSPRPDQDMGKEW